MNVQRDTEPDVPTGEFLNDIGAVGRRLGCSDRLVRELIATGELIATRINRRVLVAESDLLAFMRAHRTGGEAA
jgi:excisionase family DNA binding protein